MLATAPVLAGLLLLLVPGFILMVLFSIVGPLIVNEDLPVRASLRRPTRLVWPHFFLATIVVLVPTLLDEELTSSLERFAGTTACWCTSRSMWRRRSSSAA